MGKNKKKQKKSESHVQLTVGHAMDEGLREYVKQTLAALAQRDYDLGKFLFTVSTFAILASLAFVTALGKLYVLTLIACIPFGLSTATALKLVTQGGGEFDPEKEVITDYGEMKEHIEKIIKKWFCQFNIGVITFIVIFSTIAIDDVFNLGLVKHLNKSNPNTEVLSKLTEIQNSIWILESSLENKTTKVVEDETCVDFRELVSKYHDSISGKIDALSESERLNHLDMSNHLDRHQTQLGKTIRKYCN